MENNKTGLGLRNPLDYYPVLDLNKLKERPKLMDRIIHELSIRHMLDEYKVKLAIESQFKFVAQTFTVGKRESVRLMNLGIFGVKPNRERLFNETKDRRAKEREAKKNEQA